MLQMLKKVELLMICQKKLDFYLFSFEFLRFFVITRGWGLALVAQVQCQFGSLVFSFTVTTKLAVSDT